MSSITELNQKTKSEINEKKGIYFEEGAIEFWVCDIFDNISFFVKKERWSDQI